MIKHVVFLFKTRHLSTRDSGNLESPLYFSEGSSIPIVVEIFGVFVTLAIAETSTTAHVTVSSEFDRFPFFVDTQHANTGRNLLSEAIVRNVHIG
jgi:hypothetical protein